MKKDYLWDKTGTDPAVERLENTLRVFSFDESSRRAPAQALQPVEKPSFFRVLSFSFAAAAACLAVAIISWTQFQSVENVVFVDHGQTTTSSTEVVIPVEQVPMKPDPTVIEASPAVRRPKTNRRTTRPVAMLAKTNRRNPGVEKLTKEEIYAYNRLVLALSITGDKLNLVREKINGE